MALKKKPTVKKTNTLSLKTNKVKDVEKTIDLKPTEKIRVTKTKPIECEELGDKIKLEVSPYYLKVIIGQTILDSDHGAIAKSCATIIKEINNLGSIFKKGDLKDTTIELEEGFAVIVGSSDVILIALAGTDGKASLGLLKRNLMSISK